MLLLTLLVVVGGIGLYMALPRGRTAPARGVLALLAVAAAAMLVAILINLPSGIVTPARPTMVALSVLALLAAVRVVTHSRPVYSALYFVLLVLANAGLLLLMQAEFLATGLVIIYAGAILVTYIFVIMLAQQTSGKAPYDTEAREPLLGCLAGFVLLAVLAGGIYGTAVPGELKRAGPGGPLAAEAIDVRPDLAPNAALLSDVNRLSEPGPGHGTTERLGTHLLTSYFLAMELAGVLLLAAMVGAIAIARRQLSGMEGAA
ncbi:MAG: NADH-quinone oxidoreductase subunit J [Phycisphaerales bacterium]|nr:NADH-quinone oxidoreductase subunit J [Phycisphaerales bacterium]